MQIDTAQTSQPSTGNFPCVLTRSWPSEDAFLGIRRWARRLTPDFLWPRLSRLCRFLDALRLEVPAFLGHMRILRDERFWSVELGHPLVYLQNGRSPVRNTRTAARSHGTRQLRSRYPWASMVEHRLFLEGFDVGEKFARDSSYIPESEFVETGASEFPYLKPVSRFWQEHPERTGDL